MKKILIIAGITILLVVAFGMYFLKDNNLSARSEDASFNSSATSTCASYRAGNILFNSTNNNFWGCDGTNWLKLNN